MELKSIDELVGAPTPRTSRANRAAKRPTAIEDLLGPEDLQIPDFNFAGEPSPIPKNEAPPIEQPFAPEYNIQETPTFVEVGTDNYDEDETGPLINYELVGVKRYKYMLSPESLIFDVVTKKRRLIRYVPEMDTIWAEEQKKRGYDENVTHFSRPSIEFHRGLLRAKTNDPTLIEYLERHDQNANNPARISPRPAIFQKVDRMKIEKESYKQKQVKFKALEYAMKCDKEDLYAKAWALGIDIKRSEDRVRNDFASQAEADPQAFMAVATSRVTTVSYQVSKALEKNILSVRNGALYWGANPGGNPLLAIPLGSDATAHIAQWASSSRTPHGEEFINLLSSYLRA